MRVRLRNTWPVLPSHGPSGPAAGSRAEGRWQLVHLRSGLLHDSRSHPLIRSSARAGAQQGWSGAASPGTVCFTMFTSPPGVRTADYTLLPTEQRDLGIAGSLGYPSSWNAPPSRLLAAKQGASRRRVQGDRGFARRLLCWAGAMSPWTPGSEKIVQRQISFGILVSRAADGGQGSKSSETQPVLGWPSALAVSGLRVPESRLFLNFCLYVPHSEGTAPERVTSTGPVRPSPVTTGAFNHILYQCRHTIQFYTQHTHTEISSARNNVMG